MINENLIKEYGFKVEVDSFKKKLADLKITDSYDIPIGKIVKALKDENIECTHDEQWIYLRDENNFKQAMNKVNNRMWLVKIARHRVFEDCKGCKFLDEETKMGKLWCKKWDTDIWNIATPYVDNVVNRGCVPFRYFGYAPNVPETQTQFHLQRKAGMSEGMHLITRFANKFNLDDIAVFIREDTLVGSFDKYSSFEIRYIPVSNALYMNIVYGDKVYENKYCATPTGINNMMNDWKTIWSQGKFASDFHGNAPSQETHYDWDTSEEYKKKHNLQKSKQYETSPSNVGDGSKYPAPQNSFGEQDKDLSNF